MQLKNGHIRNTSIFINECRNELQDGIVVFAHVLGWPKGGLVQLGSVLPNPAIKVICNFLHFTNI